MWKKTGKKSYFGIVKCGFTRNNVLMNINSYIKQHEAINTAVCRIFFRGIKTLKWPTANASRILHRQVGGVSRCHTLVGCCNVLLMCLSMRSSWQEVEVDVCIKHLVKSVSHSRLFAAGLPALLHSLLHHLQPGHSVSKTH